MTNDSTYQMDNALLISDEPNGIFSDMKIIGRPGSCLCFALLLASCCLYLGKQEDICVQILQGRIMTTKTEITILIGIFCNDSISKLYVKLPHKINPTLMLNCRYNYSDLSSISSPDSRLSQLQLSCEKSTTHPSFDIIER